MFHCCSIHCIVVNNLLLKEESQCYSLASKYCKRNKYVYVLCNLLSDTVNTSTAFFLPSSSP